MAAVAATDSAAEAAAATAVAAATEAAVATKGAGATEGAAATAVVRSVEYLCFFSTKFISYLTSYGCSEKVPAE
jgi:hypothetical protein